MLLFSSNSNMKRQKLQRLLFVLLWLSFFDERNLKQGGQRSSGGARTSLKVLTLEHNALHLAGRPPLIKASPVSGFKHILLSLCQHEAPSAAARHTGSCWTQPPTLTFLRRLHAGSVAPHHTQQLGGADGVHNFLLDFHLVFFFKSAIRMSSTVRNQIIALFPPRFYTACLLFGSTCSWIPRALDSPQKMWIFKVYS